MRAAGSHPLLVEVLEPHDTKMKAIVGQAETMRQLQVNNINALFECEKKQAEDETRAQLEFFKSRLIDTIEEKRKKATEQQANPGMRRDAAGKGAGANGKRKRGDDGANGTGAPSALPASFTLKPEEVKADLEEINLSADRYSVRSAAMGHEQPATSADAYFDRSRQLLHCNGHALERESQVMIFKEGQRVDDRWTITAMNAVEVTLQAGGVKHKVTLAMLRNGRCVLRPVS